MKATNMNPFFLRIWSGGLLWCLVLGITCSSAQKPVYSVPDPPVKTGTLANGFRYVLKPETGAATSQIQLELFVHSGYQLEPEGQLQLAHFTEHLPIATFEKRIRRGGGTFSGALLQGGTYDRYTHYTYSYAYGDRAAAALGLDYYRELLSGELQWEAEVIEAEKGVFYQEYLYRNGNSLYDLDRLYSLFSNCRASAVAPAAFQAHIAGFGIDHLQDYYRNRYRPDAGVLVVTGAPEALDALELSICNRFGILKTPGEPLVYSDCETDYMARAPQFKMLESSSTDPVEGGETQMHLFLRNPVIPTRSASVLYEYWLTELFYRPLEERLLQAQQSYDAHYRTAVSNARVLPALDLQISLPAGREAAGVKQVWGILKKLKAEGISQPEFEALKAGINLTPASALTATELYLNLQLQGADTLTDLAPISVPELKKHWKEHLNYAQFNTALATFLDQVPDIGIIAPAGTPILDLKEREVRSWLEEAPVASVSQKALPFLPVKLTPELSLCSYREYPYALPGSKLFELENGVQVILHPEAGAAIALHGFRQTGARYFKDGNRDRALLVPYLIHSSGAGAGSVFALQQLRRKLGIGTGVETYVTDLECGIKMQAPASQLEALLKLTYLYMAEPRKDSLAFAYWKTKELHYYRSPPYDRNTHDLNVKAAQYLGVEDAGLTAAQRYKVVQESAMDSFFKDYKLLFQKPEAFTFILSGGFEEEHALPLLQRYLGNLPKHSAVEPFEKPVPVPLPKAPVQQDYLLPGMAAAELKLQVSFVYPLARDDWKGALDLLVMTLLLKQKLPELRYVKGRGLYLNTVFGFTNPDRELGTLSFYIPSVQGMEAILQQDIQELISELQDKPVSESQLRRLITEEVLPRFLNRRPATDLYTYARYGNLPPEAAAVTEYCDSLNPERVMEFARQMLRDSNRYVFTGRGSP